MIIITTIAGTSPIIANKKADTPIDLPKSKSKIRPNTIPNAKPNFLPANNPMNNTKITNKFGIIPLIVNHVKKLVCKKYITKNAIIKLIIAIVFFIFFLS